MKALRVLIGGVLGLSVAGSLVLLGLADPLWRWGAGVTALCFGIAALGKAFYLKLNTLRGKFHVILGAGAVTFGIAIIVGLVSETPGYIFGVHYLARLILMLSVFMMLVGLMKQGYTLSVGNWVQVLVVFAILAAIGLSLFYNLYFLPPFWSLLDIPPSAAIGLSLVDNVYSGATVLMSILVYSSLFIMLETLAIVRVHWGSDLGWRWTAGALGVMFITVGDIGMANSASSAIAAWEIVQYLGWSALSVIMCIISLMWD